jgi:hypothetical protein
MAAKRMQASFKLKVTDRKLELMIRIGKVMTEAVKITLMDEMPKVNFKFVPTKNKYPKKNRLYSVFFETRSDFIY